MQLIFNKNMTMEYSVDIKGIIDRLKEKLGLRYDNELSERLGKDPRYVSVMKGRDAIGSGVWNEIFTIAREEGIDLNWLIWGRAGAGKQPEDIIIDTISTTISDPEERKMLIRKLEDTMVSYQSIPKEERNDEILELAVRLIGKLIDK